MWIVKIALTRPYTFIVLAILILIAAPVVILGTPTDIFPNINIPVVSIAWSYTGLNPEELEGRLTTPYEKVLTTLVDNIQHIESTTIAGQVIVKVYLQQGASLDTANAQVSAASQFILRSLPPGILPPQIINFSASSVPILQLGLSGKGLSESQLNDLGLNFVRPQLVTIGGAVVPNVYGGRQRSIMLNLEPKQLQAKGLSPADVLTAMAQQNIVEPGGTAKIGEDEYDIHLNSSPFTLAGISNLPIRQVNGTTIYLHDVAQVSDGSIPQTNIVRQDGHRGVLVTVLKSGNASTLSVVSGIRALLPRIKSILPPELVITPIGDQSTFVRGSVVGVVREAVIAAVLTGLMILLFLGSWRSTVIIAISIPLSILTSVIVLGLLGQTINIMTLGGLALGRRHPRRRRYGDDRKHRTLSRAGAWFARRHPRGCSADLCSRAGLDALHLHRLPADVLPHRRIPLPVCSAGRSGSLRDACVVHSLPYAGPHAGDVPAEDAR